MLHVLVLETQDWMVPYEPKGGDDVSPIEP